MAKTNPFIKGLSPAELAKLRRKAPYIDQVYNPETNAVNYDIILNRLNTPQKVSKVEQQFLGQVKRNLQREYWRQAVQDEHVTNGAYMDQYEGSRKSLFSYRVPVYGVSGNRAQKQFDYMQSRLKEGGISDFRSGFDNYPASRSLIWGGYYRLIKPFQFMPEDYQRYRNTDAVSEPYYNELYSDRNNNEVQVDYNPPNTAGDKGRKRGSYTFPGGRAQDLALDINAPKKNMRTLETYFNRINEGIASANQRYANAKKTAEELRAQRVRAEAAQASYQRQENFNKAKFNEALKTDLANPTQDKQISALSETRGNQLEEARTRSDQKIENERIKSQEAILNKAAAKQSIPAGRLGLNFAGMRRGNTRSNAVLRALLGRNRMFGQGGNSDIGVPNQFLDMISPQKNDRSKK